MKKAKYFCFNCNEDRDHIINLCPVCGETMGSYTCDGCPAEPNGCEFSWDPYNTNGDCLAMK